MKGRDTISDFHAVYARNIERVYRLCYLRLGHREDAEDAAQNVFVRWIKSGTEFASDEHEKAYFLRAACNECSNVRRSLWRLNRVDFDDLHEPADTSGDITDTMEPDALLRSLPPRYREVLYLYYYEDYPTADIAKLLSRNESTVRTQLQKGRELLKKSLTTQSEQEDSNETGK